MELALDFSGLNELQQKQTKDKGFRYVKGTVIPFNDIMPVKRPQKPSGEPLHIEGITLPIETETPTEAPTEPVESLQREAEKIQAEREEARRVYRKYQDAVKATEQIRCDLMKAVNAGSREYQDLFLQACKGISLATGEGLFYEHILREVQKQ